jgi:hypothetical protein
MNFRTVKRQEFKNLQHEKEYERILAGEEGEVVEAI